MIRYLKYLSIIPFVWMVASWVNVVLHNTTDCCYAWWNLFTIMF